MNNKVSVKSYIFLFLMFVMMIVLSISNFLSGNLPLVFLFVLCSLILGILLILFAPKKTIKVKYGENNLFNIE